MTEGLCELFNRHARTRTHHPVAAIQEFVLGKSYYSHLKEADLSDVFAARPCYGVVWVNEVAVQNDLAGKGCFCISCKEVVGVADEMALIPGRLLPRHWREHGICAGCYVRATKLKDERYDRQLVAEQIRAAELKAWRAEKNRVSAEKAREREAARIRKRRLERAAYELLKEMGILDQVEIEDGNAARVDAKHNAAKSKSLRGRASGRGEVANVGRA